MTTSSSRMVTALITPARNEENNIGRLITCVASQTMLPVKWIIVNDDSTDNTEAAIREHLPRYPWLELVNRIGSRRRNFAAKVDCFNAGLKRIQDLKPDIIGNIDADVSFCPDYLEFLVHQFERDLRLGVGGTFFIEDSGYSSSADSFEGERHVAGGCQLFRRECFEQIGGYIPNQKGGIDWIAVTTARMMGWHTRSFKERVFHHHRSLGTGESHALAAFFNYGRKDYYLGNHPVWELFRILYRSCKKPYLVNGMGLLAGYLFEAFRGENRPISKDLMKFHRREEMEKLMALLRSINARILSPAKRESPHTTSLPGNEKP